MIKGVWQKAKFHRIGFIFSFLSLNLLIFPLFKHGLELSDEIAYFQLVRNSDYFRLETGLLNFAYLFHFLVSPGIQFFRSIFWLMQELILFYFTWNLSKIVQNKRPIGFLYVIIPLASLYSIVSPFGWLATPSYNTLALIAGYLFILAKVKVPSIFSNLILSISLSLFFLAKPPAFIAIVVILITYEIFVLKSSSRVLISRVIAPLFISVFILCVFALITRGSLIQWFTDLLDSYKNLQNINRGSYLNLKQFIPRLPNIMSLIIGFLIAVLASNYAFMKSISKYNFLFYPIIVLIIFWNHPQLYFVCLGILLANFTDLRNARNKNLLFLMYLVPLACAFGTNNLYLNQVDGAGVIALVGFLIYASDKSYDFKRVIFVLIGCVLASQILYGVANPYRLDSSLLKQNQQITLSGNSVYVDLETKKYFDEINTYTFDSQSKFLDLTGENPSFAVFSGVLPIGNSWTLSGYKGSTYRETQAIMLRKCGPPFTLYIARNTKADLQNLSVDILKLFEATDYQKYFDISYKYRNMAIYKSKNRIKLTKCVKESNLGQLSTQ